MIYDFTFKELARRGTDPAKGLEPFIFPPTVQPIDTVVVISTWAKQFGKWWGQTPFTADAPSGDPPIWTIRAEDASILSGNYQDMIVKIRCESSAIQSVGAGEH